MLHVLSIWLLVAALFAAGAFNAIGTPATSHRIRQAITGAHNGQ